MLRAGGDLNVVCKVSGICNPVLTIGAIIVPFSEALLKGNEYSIPAVLETHGGDGYLLVLRIPYRNNVFRSRGKGQRRNASGKSDGRYSLPVSGVREILVVDYTISAYEES